MFDANQRPPSFSMMQDAIRAVGNATLLSVSTFSFGIATVCYLTNVSSVKEFGLMMKRTLGGDVREQELMKMPMDEETAEIERALNDTLSVKK
jgi:hypothetical protein